MKRYQINFRGRVQGVGFRFTAKTIADTLDLTGTVENLYDGSVECYVQGAPRNIEKFIDQLENQRFIKIESFDKNEVGLKEDENEFIII